MYAVRPSFVGERVADYLAARHPSKTADNVAVDLGPWGINRDTIAQMLQRKTAPNAVHMLALIWAYGPEFLAEVLPAQVGWLSAASRDQKRAALDHAMARIKAERDALE